jgi:RNA polymerase primary sigma factor
MRELQAEKSKIQVEAVEALISNKGGIVEIATGGGKSKIAIDFIKKVQTEVVDTLSILLVVPTEKLRDENWKDEFGEWSDFELYNKIDRYCYASINKLVGKTYDIVILDELQNITPNNAEFFNQNTAIIKVGLTATVPKEKEKVEVLRMAMMDIVYTLTLDDAVARGVVAPFQITTIGFHLDGINKTVSAGSKAKNWLTTEVKQYDYYTKLIAQLRDDDSRARPQSLKFAILNRMHFLYNLQTREIVAKYVLEKIISKEEKTLIFAGNIKLAENLEKNSFHSKTNDKAFKKFVNGDLNRLSAVKSLNEGINIPLLDNALIAQVNSKERHLIQKVGRVVRYRPNHKANIYILYAIGTADEEWMKKSLENIDKSNIKHTKIKLGVQQRSN